MKKNQTITYDEDDQKDKGRSIGLFDKMIAGFNLQKFGNFFRGESPAPKNLNEPLKSERGAYNSRTQPTKPPLYFEKRQSQQIESLFLQKQASLAL